MTELFSFVKNLPWKSWAPWLVLLVLTNIFVIWIKINNTDISNWTIYGIFIADVLIAIIALVLEYQRQNKITEQNKVTKSEMLFKKDVDAENAEFGNIKRDAKLNRNTKITFEGKVNAKNSKFGNIE